MASVNHITARAMAHAQTSTTNRRALLGGLAVAPLAAQAEPAHPDAALLELERRFDAADAQYRDAADRADDLEIVGLPTVPDALYLRRGDYNLDLDLFVNSGGDRFWYYGACRDHTSSSHGQQRCLKCWREAGNLRSEVRVRVDEIVNAYDAWMAAREKAQQDSGYRALHALARSFAAVCREIDDQIREYIPLTLEGLAVKARQLQRLVDRDCDVCDEAIVVIQDILRMAETSDIGRARFRELAAGLPAIA